jgi:hypothetical protein
VGKKSPSPPPPPDPVATANAQAAANKETAIAQARLNATNQITPFGTLTYRDLGVDQTGVPQYQVEQKLAPQQQAIFDQQQQLAFGLSQLGNQYASRIGDATRNPFSLEGLPNAPTADDASRQRIEQALFDRLNPQMDRQRAAMETTLKNQGITLGSEAWRSAMDDMGRQENDLRLATVGQGGAEQSRLFGLETTARQNALNERLMERNQPINEVAALLGTSPGVAQPQFTNVNSPQLQPTDVIGPTYSSYQGQLANHQAQMGQQNAAMGGLFGLGSAALGGWAMGGFPKFW